MSIDFADSYACIYWIFRRGLLISDPPTKIFYKRRMQIDTGNIRQIYGQRVYNMAQTIGYKYFDRYHKPVTPRNKVHRRQRENIR